MQVAVPIVLVCGFVLLLGNSCGQGRDGGLKFGGLKLLRLLENKSTGPLSSSKNTIAAYQRGEAVHCTGLLPTGSKSNSARNRLRFRSRATDRGSRDSADGRVDGLADVLVYARQARS